LEDINSKIQETMSSFADNIQQYPSQKLIAAERKNLSEYLEKPKQHKFTIDGEEDEPASDGKMCEDKPSKPEVLPCEWQKRQEVDLTDFLCQKARKVPKNPSLLNAVSLNRK